MKMMTAAVVASQVLLAMACGPIGCAPGCRVMTRNVRQRRERAGTCPASGTVLNLYVQVTPCESVVGGPTFTGSCTEGPNGQALCTGEGSCRKTLQVSQLQQWCSCPPSPPAPTAQPPAPTAQPPQPPAPTPEPDMPCESDKHCPFGEFCRAKETRGECSATAKVCVSFAKEGEACGGLVLPCFQARCGPGLQCKGDGLALDRPGTCVRATACPEGTVEDSGCTRSDFAERVCHKETLCDEEVACRKL